MTERDKNQTEKPKAIKVKPEDRKNFEALKRIWQEETFLMSDLYHMQNNEAFQAIVEMGEVAIPLILRDLREEPSWIFMALYQLTQRPDPLQEKSDNSFIRLDFDALKDDWIQWGEENGYISKRKRKSPRSI